MIQKYLRGYMFAILLAFPVAGWSLEIAIDTGHAPSKFGATSSTCKKEYDYNLALSRDILS